MTEEEKFKKRLDRGTFQLEPDFFAGFKTSVRNGQTLLAMEYLVELVTDLQNEVVDLKSQLAVPKTFTKTPKKIEEKIEATA